MSLDTCVTVGHVLAWVGVHLVGALITIYVISKVLK